MNPIKIKHPEARNDNKVTSTKNLLIKFALLCMKKMNKVKCTSNENKKTGKSAHSSISIEVGTIRKTVKSKIPKTAIKTFKNHFTATQLSTQSDKHVTKIDAEMNVYCR